MNVKSFLLFANTLVIATSSSAFESDVHFGLTQWLAEQAGFDRQQAETIATGDQRVDSGDMQFIELGLAHACSGHDDESSRHSQRMHFPSAGRVPAAPDERAVAAGGDAAKQPAIDMTKVSPGQAVFLLIKLGEALHTLQDSWSHQGISDVPNFPGGAIKCDATRVWAHPKARGGWNSHKADITMFWPADTQAMAKATYDIVTRFPQISGISRSAKDWSAIAPRLDSFIKASTKTEKKRWFVAQGITDVSFLQGISLPDGAEPFELEWPRRKLPLLTTSQSNQHRIAPELRDFYSRFFAQWVSTDRLDALASDVVAPIGPADRRAHGMLSPAMDKVQLAGLLKIWRLRDHGSVAELAHMPQRLAPKQLATIDALAKKPKAYASYAMPAQAFFPLLAKGPDVSPLLPFLIGEAPASPQGNSRAIAIAKFRHAPYDTVGAVAEKIDGRWRIISIISTVEH
jgi:hypothetical protein